MNILPSELLHGIFIRLPVIQQLQCMLVSRRWAKIIHGRSLYHEVYLDNEDMFQHFLGIVKQKPDLANNVEHLSLCRSRTLNTYEREILELFPNLKNISYGRFDYSEGTANASDKNKQPISLKNRLEHISDTSKCSIIKLALVEGLCTHLVTLRLRFSIDYKATNNYMIPLLKGMPVLKNLWLSDTPITINDFEMLHTNIPSLQSLKLQDMRLLLSHFPTEIKPTTLFTKLDVYGEFEDPQTKYDWFKYIIEKYPRLERLVYSIMDWIPDDFDKTNLIIRAEHLDVLRKLGPQLKTVSQYGGLDSFSTEFRTSDSKWQMKKMIFRECITQTDLNALVQLHQFKFIESLYLCISTLPFPLTKLENMKHLKVLKLQFYQSDDSSLDDDTESVQEYRKSITLNLDELFQHLHSTVKSVEIRCLYAVFDDDDDGTETQYNNITKLKLDISTPQKKIDEFITKRLPNVHSLILSDCYKLGETLNFPKHHFSYLMVYSYYHYILNVSIITDDFSTPHYYTTNSSYFNEYAEFNDFLLVASAENIDESKLISLNCRSVKRLVLGSANRGDKEALLIPF